MIAIFLDAGPLSEACRKPGLNTTADALQNWLQSLGSAGVVYLVAEITDYEVRRELLRTGKTTSITRLDLLERPQGCFVPLTTAAMKEAANLWAQARNGGMTTAPPEALDGDVILAAQVRTWAASMGVSLSEVIIATTNPAHLTRFVPADLWQNIIV